MQRVFSDVCPRFSDYFKIYDGLYYQIYDLVDDVARIGWSLRNVVDRYGVDDFAMFLEFADMFFEEEDVDG